MAEILVGNEAIRNAVRDIMRSRDAKKIIVVAFVGAGAERYILGRTANANRLQVICWDKEGCTNPETIRTLRDRGVQVRFARNLHMKLYWAENRGAVIGSANLSNNGLGDKGLHELAVRVAASEVDIRGLLNTVESQAVTPALLADLFRRTADYRRRNHGSDVFDKTIATPITFEEWLVSRQPVWKFFVYREHYTEDPAALAEHPAFNLQGSADYWSGTSWHTTPSEWLLHVDVNNWEIKWAMADYQIPMTRKDPNRQPPSETHYAVQTTQKPGLPPFRLTPTFRSAVRQFVEREHIQTYEDCAKYTQAHQGGLTRPQMQRLAGIYKGLRR